MIRLRILAALTFVILAMPNTATAVGKVSLDPNTAANAKAAPVDDSDKRLLQKVSCDLGYTRLHYVLEELSAKTKVTIRCGASKDDWQTRDLPVVVCAKNIPLGKLLRAIADSTHMDLSAETIDPDKGNQEKVYRVWFSAKSQTELDSYRAEEREAGLAEQNRAWDTLVAGADIPGSAVTTAGSLADAILTRQALGRILQSLGPEAKAKAMAGQKIELTLSAYDKPDLFREFYRLAQKDAPVNRSVKDLKPPTEEQMDAATITISASNDSATGQFDVYVRLAPVHNGDSTVTTWHEPLEFAADEIRDRIPGAKLPEAEKTVRSYPSPPDHISKDLVRMSLIPEPGEQPAAILSQKVKLDLPKDRDVTYADVMAALAKASGLTIVSEDFLSHRQRVYMAQSMGASLGDESSAGAKKTYLSPLGPNPLKEMTVGEVLAMLAWPNHRGMLLDWFVSDKNKLIVGRSTDWLRNHQYMMPESLLTYLRDKANGDGIELDDLSRLSGYTSSQRGNWVRESKDLYFVNYAVGDEFFWRFYEKLTPPDKAQARSDEGLPLAKYDTVWIADFVKANANKVPTLYGAMTLEEQRRMKEEADRRVALFTDPEVIRGMVLTIKTKPSSFWTTFKDDSIGAYTSSIPEGIDRHTYDPVIEGKSKEGQKFSVQLDPLYNAFPIYSPKREAEMAEQREKAKPILVH